MLRPVVGGRLNVMVKICNGKIKCTHVVIVIVTYTAAIPLTLAHFNCE